MVFFFCSCSSVCYELSPQNSDEIFILNSNSPCSWTPRVQMYAILCCVMKLRVIHESLRCYLAPVEALKPSRNIHTVKGAVECGAVDGNVGKPRDWHNRKSSDRSSVCHSEQSWVKGLHPSERQGVEDTGLCDVLTPPRISRPRALEQGPHLSQTVSYHK